MIEFSHVSFRYAASAHRALDDVSFHIGSGECVVLTGRSGCGKSTLINLVNGLLPKHENDEMGGALRIRGHDIDALKRYEIARHVGAVFQNPKSQFFNLDTDSEVAFGLENAGIPNPQLRTRVDETIDHVGIRQLSGRSIFELSGGEKQRVAIAGAYALGPEIYVLDEPSANLDHRATNDLAELLAELKAQGRTILVSEHKLGYLRNLADRYIVLETGEVLGDYTADEFNALPVEQRHTMGLRALSLAEATQARQRPAEQDGRHPVLEAAGLTVSFRGRAVLNNLSLTLSSGEIVGLIGENGAGKTTLVRTLCGLQKTDSGDFASFGKPVKQSRLRGNAFLVMQDVNSQLFGETVAEECAIGVRNPDQGSIKDILDELDLGNYADRHPLSLSGGQKQRAAIASALSSGRGVLIFDEPTSGLDRESMLEITRLIRHIAGSGTAVLIISHDVEFLARACTRVEELQDGRLKPSPDKSEDPTVRLREFFGQGRENTQ